MRTINPCQSTCVGRVSTDISNNISTDTRPILGRQLIDTELIHWPIHASTDIIRSSPTVDRYDHRHIADTPPIHHRGSVKTEKRKLKTSFHKKSKWCFTISAQVVVVVNRASMYSLTFKRASMYLPIFSAISPVLSIIAFDTEYLNLPRYLHILQ